MSERPSSGFDDYAAGPQPPSAEGGVPASGPRPPWLRGGEQPPDVPGVDRGQWRVRPVPPDADPPSPGNDDLAPESAPSGFPPPPGSHRSTPPGSDDATAAVDPAPVVGQHRQHHATPPGVDDATSVVDLASVMGQQQRFYPRQAPGPAPEFGGVNDPYGRQSYNAPNPGAWAPRPAEPVPGFTGRPGPSWQQPPQPQQAPPGARPQEQGWSQAQGSAASWNYVDNIRSSELVPTRRIPPRHGWRRAVYSGTFKLINPGQSPDERYQAALETKIRSLLRGRYKIGVLGKGGVGKSTISASLGSVFAELRQDDRVVAIDADTAFGKLSTRIDPAASGSYWELAGDRSLNTFADMRSRVGSNSAGLFVLAGESATARRRVLDPAVYRAATAQLDRHFTLSIVDCGSTMDSAVTREVLNDVDALIVVSSPWFDGASSAGQTLEWLANGGFTALLHRTVVVVNDSDGHADKRDIKLLVERFGKHGQKVIEMPYDGHLRPGGVIDVENQVSPRSRRRLLELAAECAEHFAATADRPRGM